MKKASVSEGVYYDLRRQRKYGKQLMMHRSIGPGPRSDEVDYGDFPTSLKWALKTFRNGSVVFMDMVRAYIASENDRSNGDAQRLVDEWDRLYKAPKVSEDGERIPAYVPNLDNMCADLKIASATAYGWFSEMAFLHGINIARVNTAVHAPVIASASVERALDVKNGGNERRVLFEVFGLLRGKNTGPMVAIQQNTSLPAPAVGDGTTVRTFEDSQRAAALILRTPPKLVGASSTARSEEPRVSPSDHRSPAGPARRE